MFNKSEKEFLNRLSGKDLSKYSRLNKVIKEFKYLGLSLCIGLMITFVVALTITINSLETYAEVTSQDLQESVLRLHIRANSNSEEDQALKLKVRDALLEEFRPELTSAKSKEELISIIESNHDRIIETANRVIKENGYDYDVRAKVGEAYLETKKYGNVSLPAGTYDALIIEIGSGEGKNWWCVLFPPLCYVVTDETIPDKDKAVLQASLTEEEYEVITNQENIDVKLKFNVLEAFGKQ